MSRPEFPLSTVDDVRAGQNVEWLWSGLLPVGGVSLWTSQWKSGKTTLLSILLARMENGGELAGLAVRQGNALVISEEGCEHWRSRTELFQTGRHVSFFFRPFRGRPSLDAWERLLDAVLDHHAKTPLALVAVDPLASVISGCESSAGLMLDALMPLLRLTAAGVSVMLLHHPRKGESLAGQSARGSGALSAFVDVQVEMSLIHNPEGPGRRRLLQTWSRLSGTPPRLMIELDEDGRNYTSRGDPHAFEFTDQWPKMELLFKNAKSRLTRWEVRNEWPTDVRTELPHPRSLHRWLKLAVDLGLLASSGQGHARDPYRYYLPDRQSQLKSRSDWDDDPFFDLYAPKKKDGPKK